MGHAEQLHTPVSIPQINFMHGLSLYDQNASTETIHLFPNYGAIMFI